LLLKYGCKLLTNRNDASLLRKTFLSITNLPAIYQTPKLGQHSLSKGLNKG